MVEAVWDNTTLGTLRLNGARLVVEVNSARWRARTAKEIVKRLGPSAALVEREPSVIRPDVEAAWTEGVEPG